MLDWQWALAVAIGGVVAAQIAYLIATTLAAAVFRFPVDIISLGAGPTLLKLRVGGVTLRAALFVFSGYVKFKDVPEHEPPAPGTFIAAPWWQRLIAAIIGPIGMIAVAGPFLFADTIPVALSAIEFCAGLVLNPAQTIDLTAALTSLRETRGTLGAVAVVSAFTGGLQFLPISFMAGGTAILYLAEAFHGEPLPPRLLELIHRLFFGVAVALLILATIAIVR